MAISINWGTRVIYIPQSYLTLVTGSLYELDVDELRLDLKNLEDSEEGMAFPATHSHNTQVTLSGVTYVRTFEVINGYTVEFENGTYSARCVGANHNIGDVKVVNSVSLIIGNSAGMIVSVVGSGVTEQDKADIVDLVWGETLEGSYTAAQVQRLMAAALAGKLSGAPAGPVVIRDIGDSKNRITATVDASGNRTAVTLDGS